MLISRNVEFHFLLHSVPTQNYPEENSEKLKSSQVGLVGRGEVEKWWFFPGRI